MEMPAGVAAMATARVEGECTRVVGGTGRWMEKWSGWLEGKRREEGWV